MKSVSIGIPFFTFRSVVFVGFDAEDVLRVHDSLIDSSHKQRITESPPVPFKSARYKGRRKYPYKYLFPSRNFFRFYPSPSTIRRRHNSESPIETTVGNVNLRTCGNPSKSPTIDTFTFDNKNHYWAIIIR